jgi:uncharacterized protein GlcG (DUF336 family)
MMLTLDLANTICTTALQRGRELELAPLCVVVLDAGGHPLALQRSESASISRPEIATAKAAGCLGMGFGGREIARRASMVPGFIAALNEIFPKGILPVPGGVLIRDAQGVLIGAVGISGDTSDNDEICALAGIHAAGLQAETGA